MGGFGGASLGLGGGAMCMQIGTAKAITSVTFGGALNMAYNFSPDQSAWVNLGYFAAGAIGSYAGIAAGAAGVKAATAIGMGVGGVSNVTVGAFSGNIENGYQAAQHFVGGALSSLSGMSVYGKWSGSNQANYITKYKKVKGFKRWDDQLFLKGFSYGLQALATDFAYTDQKYFMDRTVGQHLLTFGGGFMNGALQYGGNKIGDKMLKSQNFSNLSVFGTNLAFSYVGYTGQYLANYANFGYNPFNYKGKNEKFGIAAFKSLFYGLAINR